MRLLLSVAVVAAALTFAGASHAATGRSSDQVTLTIVTVPRLAGVHFSLDGRTFVTGPQGEVRIHTTHGRHRLQILDTSLRAPGLRSTFLRWGDSRYSPARALTIGHNTVLDAGFQQSVLVHFSFADRTGHPVVGRVTKLTLSNTLGNRISFAPSWPQWLLASSIARRFTGLERTPIQYSIERALVGGSNVVNESQQRFYPASTRHVTARLLLYSARVDVHDFVFGTGAGSRLDLIYPDGTRTSYPLRGRPLVLSSLPRGTYRVRIEANGYVPTVSLALSKNQVLSVKVISYYDMLLFLAVVLGTVSALILIPRPYLRLRLRSVGSGRRPTPDDLEPLKPLSGERKQLIHTYMPDRITRGPRPTGSQLPAQARRATVLATGRRSVRPGLRNIPAHLVGSAVYRLRRFGDGFPIVSGLRRRREGRSTVPRDFLAGERIELIHVYMGEQIAATQEAAVAARQAQELDAAPDAAPAAHARTESAAAVTGTGSMLRRAVAAARAGTRRFVRLASLRSQTTRPAPVAGETPAAGPDGVAPPASMSPAPAIPEAAAPAAEDKTEPPPEKKPAPPARKRRTPAIPEIATPAIPEAAAPATQEKTEPSPEKGPAPAIPETAAPAAEDKTEPSPETKPAPPARKRRTPAIPEIATPAIPEAAAPATQEKTEPSPEKGPAPAIPETAAPAAEDKTEPSPEKGPAPATPEAATPAAEDKTEPSPEKGPAPTIPETAAPAAEDKTEPSPEKKPAPPARKRRTPARRASAASAEETTKRPKRKRATTKRKTTAPAKPRKTTARAKPKTNASAKGQARAKAKPKKEQASPQPATQRPARRTRAAAEPETDAPSGTTGETGNGTVNQDLELLRPDLAAALKTLQDDLREARNMITEKKTQKRKKRRKSSNKAST